MGLASIAYADYLLPVFRAVETLIAEPPALRVPKALFALALAIAFAKASWGGVAKPLVRLGHRVRYE